ncbi:MAG: TRM11 family SAM-dependent methyltransferase [bacterium]
MSSSYYFQIVQKNRTRSVNQYLTHWIYPYKGKFHPQMIRALLNIIGLKEGDTVLDPFIGSGTTAVEAQLLGINCIGIDVSPLCVLQSRVKTESMDVLSQIIEWKKEIVEKIKPSLFNFEGETLDDIIKLIPNEKVKNFYRMVKLVAISDNARRGREFSNSFFKNLELMISSVKDYADIVKELNLKLGKVDIRTGDSRALPLDDESIDGMVTSPPYSIALDYVVNDAHALKELGYNLSEIREEFIGVRGKGQTKIDLYNEDMKKSLKEMFRVLKPKKYAVIVIGNATYLGQEIKTVEFIIDYAEKIGFRLVKNIDKIIFGLYNVMQKENILIFQKLE